MFEESSISVDNESLISLVKGNPVLWDKTTDLYKNRVATQMAWKEILLVLDPNFETKDEKARQAYAKLIIQRWTHIRDNYNRSYKKIIDQIKSGSAAKTVKPYIYSKQLSFLNKVIEPRETVSNVTENIIIGSEPQGNNYEANEPLETHFVHENIATVSPKRIPKRRLKNASSLDAKIIKLMESFSNNEPKTMNRHISFFYGILPSLERFEDDEVLDFQMGVLQLLKKIKNNRQNRKLANVPLEVVTSLQSPTS